MRSRSYYDRVVLNRLWQFTSRNEVTLELFDLECSEDDMQTVIEDIDRIGTNPFRWVSAYKDVQTLVSELAYRPEVAGVVDIPSRGLMYGSHYYAMEGI
jgi:hypothetical protein